MSSTTRKRRRRGVALVLGVLLVGSLGGALWLYNATRPAAVGKTFYMRLEKPTDRIQILKTLGSKGVVRDIVATEFALRVLRAPATLRPGTYRFAPGDGLRALNEKFAAPMRVNLRLREMRWIARTAARLQAELVCPAKAYREEAGHAERFRARFPFVPEKGSLEGYLSPDTYNLPPLVPAKEVVAMQLTEFGREIAPLLKGQDAREILTLASLIEMEASDPVDRRKIAGVIRNRIKKRMRLQIDATVLYGRQRWGRLFYKDYTRVKSPYNTYLVAGLPPGPICSPTVEAVKAALNPAVHNDVFYVALPDGRTIYAPDYETHKRNVALRRSLMGQTKPTP